MDRGLYSAASGGLLESRHIDIVANNLANASTVGFKAQRLVSREQAFDDTLAAKLQNAPAQAESDLEQVPGVVDVESVTDFSLGPISPSENPLHVALRKPNQFFVAQTETGPVYTRAGNFSLNGTGTLVTADGLPVLGEGGPITLPPGASQITASGAVIVNNAVVSKLRVVEVSDLSSLTRTEGVRFTLAGEGQAPSVAPDLVPRSLELPNISVIEAMVQMIDVQKSFEAYTKTVRAIDDLNTEAILQSRSIG